MSQPTSEPPKPHPALEGARAAIGLPVILIGVTMVGVGGLARDVGYPVGAAALSTLLIWAGPAQVILFGSVAAGVALPAIALAILVSSMRFLPMTVSILPLARSRGSRRWQEFLAAHFVSMTTWVEGLRRLPDVPEERRMQFFLGFSTMIIGGATLATIGGFYLYTAVPTAIGAALLFMTPIFFAASLVASARRRDEWTAVVLGALLSLPAFAVLPSGADFLAVGVVGGSIAFLARSRREPAP
ncbi:MAG TPA: AzlC family ABC transporter permease [Beijerinckiaceae bacterium]|nr:AzlC family ABC transporter permease [Beijerinckiaceae bacterium]